MTYAPSILLANADPVIVGMAAVNMLVSVVLAIVMTWFGIRQRRVEDMEKRITSLVASSADERHQLTTKLVDERFRAMTHELGNSGQQLVMAVAELKQRVKDAEAELDGAGDRNHKAELAVSDKLDQIKDLIRNTAATKQDMERHEKLVNERDQRMQDRLGKVETSVAVLAEASRLGGKRGQ